MKSILVKIKLTVGLLISTMKHGRPPAHLLGHPAIGGRVKGGRGRADGQQMRRARTLWLRCIHTLKLAERREGAEEEEEEEDVTY